jgi:hypothetical protein
MAAVELTLEAWVVQRNELQNALAKTRAALEFVAEESSDPVMVENARVALSLTDEAAGVDA